MYPLYALAEVSILVLLTDYTSCPIVATRIHHPDEAKGEQPHTSIRRVRQTPRIIRRHDHSLQRTRNDRPPSTRRLRILHTRKSSEHPSLRPNMPPLLYRNSSNLGVLPLHTHSFPSTFHSQSGINIRTMYRIFNNVLTIVFFCAGQAIIRSSESRRSTPARILVIIDTRIDRASRRIWVHRNSILVPRNQSLRLWATTVYKRTLPPITAYSLEASMFSQKPSIQLHLR